MNVQITYSILDKENVLKHEHGSPEKIICHHVIAHVIGNKRLVTRLEVSCATLFRTGLDFEEKSARPKRG